MPLEWAGIRLVPQHFECIGTAGFAYQSAFVRLDVDAQSPSHWHTPAQDPQEQAVGLANGCRKADGPNSRSKAVCNTRKI